MESVLGRVLVMVVAGVLGGLIAILLLRAEARQRLSAGRPEDKRLLQEATSSAALPETKEADVPRAGRDIPIGPRGPSRPMAPRDDGQSRRELDPFEGLLTRRTRSSSSRSRRRRLLSLSADGAERAEEDDDDDDVGRGRFSSSGERRRLRHPRRKAHHHRRRLDEGFPGAGREAGGAPGPVRSTPAPDGGTQKGRDAEAVASSSSSSSAPTSSDFVWSFDSGDSAGRGRGVAAVEVEEAVLLAVPLSLLLTLLLLLCAACCCCYCRCRTRHHDDDDDDDQDQEPLTSDPHDQWTTLGLGVCEACLPDISYQVHVAKKTRSSRKRRPEPALEGDPRPPLYALLSNLPPGSSRLEGDPDPPGPRPRRSHSLEFLAV